MSIEKISFKDVMLFERYPMHSVSQIRHFTVYDVELTKI